MLEVLTAAVLAAVFLGEIPNLRMILGGSIILAAAAAVVVKANGQRKKEV